MSKPKENVVNKLIPKVFNVIFLIALVYAGWYGWQLYQSYSAGYAKGEVAGKAFYQDAIRNHWRSLSFQKEKARFIKEKAPKVDSTWKAQLYLQGWCAAIDVATENIPK